MGTPINVQRKAKDSKMESVTNASKPNYGVQSRCSPTKAGGNVHDDVETT